MTDSTTSRIHNGCNIIHKKMFIFCFLIPVGAFQISLQITKAPGNIHNQWYWEWTNKLCCVHGCIQEKVFLVITSTRSSIETEENMSKSLNLHFPCPFLQFLMKSIIQLSSFLFSYQTPVTFSSDKSENNMNLVNFQRKILFLSSFFKTTLTLASLSLFHLAVFTYCL